MDFQGFQSALSQLYLRKNLQEQQQKLEALSYEEIVELMEEVLRRDTGRRVLVSCVTMIGYSFSEEIDLLVLAARSRYCLVRYHACWNLSLIKDARSVEALAQILRDDPEPDVRYMAIVALGELGDRRALPALRQAQTQDHAVTREGVPIAQVAAQMVNILTAQR